MVSATALSLALGIGHEASDCEMDVPGVMRVLDQLRSEVVKELLETMPPERRRRLHLYIESIDVAQDALMGNVRKNRVPSSMAVGRGTARIGVGPKVASPDSACSD